MKNKLLKDIKKEVGANFLARLTEEAEKSWNLFPQFAQNLVSSKEKYIENYVKTELLKFSKLKKVKKDKAMKIFNNKFF